MLFRNTEGGLLGRTAKDEMAAHLARMRRLTPQASQAQLADMLSYEAISAQKANPAGTQSTTTMKMVITKARRSSRWTRSSELLDPTTMKQEPWGFRYSCGPRGSL